eukprot:scaffold115809_cov19-Tisochrysis_lutea.AAC.2
MAFPQGITLLRCDKAWRSQQPIHCTLRAPKGSPELLKKSHFEPYVPCIHQIILEEVIKDRLKCEWHTYPFPLEGCTPGGLTVRLSQETETKRGIMGRPGCVILMPPYITARPTHWVINEAQAAIECTHPPTCVYTPTLPPPYTPFQCIIHAAPHLPIAPPASALVPTASSTAIAACVKSRDTSAGCLQVHMHVCTCANALHASALIPPALPAAAAACGWKSRDTQVQAICRCTRKRAQPQPLAPFIALVAIGLPATNWTAACGWNSRSTQMQTIRKQRASAH